MQKISDLNKRLESILEVKAGRAWNNKLKKIDALMSWMYDKNILSQAEKNEKDKIFKQYYRYYNDGDFPKILQGKITKYANEKEISILLEEKLEEFIKKILAKYLPKINKKEFKLDDMKKYIEDILRVTNDPHSLIYFIKKKNISDESLNKLILQLNDLYSQWKNEVKKIDNMLYNRTFEDALSQLKKDGKINSKLNNLQKEIKTILIDIESFYKKFKLSLD